MYTVNQAAEKLNKGVSTVRKWCAILNCPKPGRDYIITEEFFKQITERIHDSVGRPSIENHE